jgi:hypothetical protein
VTAWRARLELGLFKDARATSREAKQPVTNFYARSRRKINYAPHSKIHYMNKLSSCIGPAPGFVGFTQRTFRDNLHHLVCCRQARATRGLDHALCWNAGWNHQQQNNNTRLACASGTSPRSTRRGALGSPRPRRRGCCGSVIDVEGADLFSLLVSPRGLNSAVRSP